MADGPETNFSTNEIETADAVGRPVPAGVVAPDEHALNARVRRNLLFLSWANWGVAIVTWTISVYLGITSPASIMVYTVLFVIGIFAVVVAIAAFLLEKFAHRPEPIPSEPLESDEREAAATPSA